MIIFNKKNKKANLHHNLFLSNTSRILQILQASKSNEHTRCCRGDAGPFRSFKIHHI